ncbi:Type II secretion system F protein [metagenome]|uniref:Type II secretion system F protein n=1 Tax=metagenome TaxID=256318 RepID=A0A2P2CC24_9ZZZZ
MSPGLWGVLSGAGVGCGLLLVAARVAAIRRPLLSLRVLPYVRDLTETTAQATAPATEARTSAVSSVFGPLLVSAAHIVERSLGGAISVRRRLERAGLHRSVHEFRIEQVQWGLIGFGVLAAYGVMRAVSGPANAVASLMLCLIGFVVGLLLRDQRLTAQAVRRERRILAEFPTVSELLALAVAAGESPVSALTRVAERSRGELSLDLERVLAEIRTGVPVGRAFDALAARTGLPVVARFAEGIAVAVERGTPLADVLHAQAADVREAGRRELIETAARKEVLMMVPVVFLVLPVTVMFAFWPGLVGLDLSSP